MSGTRVERIKALQNLGKSGSNGMKLPSRYDIPPAITLRILGRKAEKPAPAPVVTLEKDKALRPMKALVQAPLKPPGSDDFCLDSGFFMVGSVFFFVRGLAQISEIQAMHFGTAAFLFICSLVAPVRLKTAFCLSLTSLVVSVSVLFGFIVSASKSSPDLDRAAIPNN